MVRFSLIALAAALVVGCGGRNMDTDDLPGAAGSSAHADAASGVTAEAGTGIDLDASGSAVDGALAVDQGSRDVALDAYWGGPTDALREGDTGRPDAALGVADAAGVDVATGVVPDVGTGVARDANPDGDRRGDESTPTDGSPSDAGNGSTEASSDGGAVTPDEGGIAGCGPAASVVALGNWQRADCGLAFEISEIVQGDAGNLYFFSAASQSIFAWSAVTGACRAPIALAAGASYLAYSSVNHRLYVAYASGSITSIDPDTGAEQAFAHTPISPVGLATAGRYVFAADPSGAWGTHYTFSPTGTLISSVEWNYYSREYVWSEVNSRMYFLRDNMSPNDLHWEHIECSTGRIDGAGESPYHGAFDIAPPIRVSPSGQLVLLGAGEIYDGLSIERVTSLPGSIVDAAWLPDGKLLVLRDSGGTSVVEQRGGERLRVENVQRFVGTPAALRSLGDGAVVVTTINSAPTFSVYHANVDGDGDGVAYSGDSFPLDPAASRDTDHDGYPDAWNAGAAVGSSPLTLDAFPNDSACHLSSQARADDASRCDIPAAIPPYTPDSIVFDGSDIVYLLGASNHRIDRHSMSAGGPLNPFILRDSAALITYSASHGRIYLAYDDGSMTSIALSGSEETDFATLPRAAHGLASAGAFLLGADASGAWNTHYTFDIDGNLISAVEWNYYSVEYAWSEANGRIYFFRDDTSPDDLHWENIDQTNGTITAAGETPYHGDYLIQRPIRVSLDGHHVLLGSGDIYDGILLNHELALPVSPLDAVWLSDGSLVVLTADGGLHWFDHTFVAGRTEAVSGVPLRIFPLGNELVIVTSVGGAPSFSRVSLQ